MKLPMTVERKLAVSSGLASESGVHPTQISEWKATLMTEGASLFERRPVGKGQATMKTVSELYEQIGRLKMELEWLKKKAAGFS